MIILLTGDIRVTRDWVRNLRSLLLKRGGESIKWTMKIKITFEDVFDVENEEQAYDLLLDYCNEVANNEDVTAFVFEEV